MREGVVRAFGCLGVAVACVVAGDAQADDPTIVVTWTGTMQTEHVEIASVTGGTTTPSRSVGGLTTASIQIPLTITRSTPDSALLRFAATDLVSPHAYSHVTIKADSFQRTSLGSFQLFDTKLYDDISVTRIDIPGNHGPISTHGSFVITANISKGSDSAVTAPPGQLPAIHHETVSGGVPLVWIASLDGLSTSTKMPPDGYFTFEKFSITPTGATPTSLTLHSSLLTTQEVKNWMGAHPNGQAKIIWRSNTTNLFFVSFKNVTVSSVTNDSTKGDGPAPITVQLTGTQDQVITN